MASVAISWRAPLEGLANRDATSDCAGLAWLSVTNSSSTRLALLLPVADHPLRTPALARTTSIMDRSSLCRNSNQAPGLHLGPRLRETLPAGHADAVVVAARDSSAIGTGQKEHGSRSECPASCFAH